MTVTGEKKFVIKHTFKNLKWSEFRKHYAGDKENHFRVTWRIDIITNSFYACIFLECLPPNKNPSWKISTEINGKIGANGNNMNLDNPNQTYPGGTFVKNYIFPTFNQFLSNGNVTIEFEVKITEMSGIEIPKLRNFEDDNAKEHSDVMLKIGEQKFYVNKMYLSLHSSYFKSLFSENFEESRKSEIELKDIDPDDMQKFLEVLYGEDAIDDDNVAGILHLADMYDSKTTTKRCESFLSKNSERSVAEKFKFSMEFQLDNLTTK